MDAVFTKEQVIPAGPPISFSPPFVDEAVVSEVMDSLRSGWITTGPKVAQLEVACQQLSGCSNCICVNSWTSGAALVFKWWGLQAGDEVIIPAYTYAATALAVLHAGGTPVMVDIRDDLTIDIGAIEKVITSKTKAVIPVDIGGLPCDYDSLHGLFERDVIKKMFRPSNEAQIGLGRPLIISDAAHSIGAQYHEQPSAQWADVTIYSFHAVKNVTTAEGGAVCLNLPYPLNNTAIYSWMKLNSMNGQTKDAFSKSVAGNWKYDIVSDGLKINMPDILAAIGLAQIKKYEGFLLPERKRVFLAYYWLLRKYDWAQLPFVSDNQRVSACHLFPLRIHNITEEDRDEIIKIISSLHIAVNVHFTPLPMFKFFKEMGFDIGNYPVSYDQYSRVITLPIYPQLTNSEVERIVESVAYAYNEVISK